MLHLPNLSAREKEILPSLLAGATRTEIASEIGISTETVKIHVRNILKKFEVLNVRDGFSRLSEYQTYFGVGGYQMDRFINSAECRVNVVHPTQEIVVSTRINLTVMAEEIDKFIFTLFRPDCKFSASVENHDVIGPIEQDGRSLFSFLPNKKLRKGDTYEYKINVTIKAKKNKAIDQWLEETSFPAAFRSYEIQFSDTACVEKFGFQVFSRLHELNNYPFQVNQGDTWLKCSDHSPQVPLRVKLWWQ